MKRLITLIVVFCFLSVLTSCAGREVLSTPEPQTGSASEEAPISQPLTTRVSEIKSEPSSESPAQAETAVETQLAEVAAKESSPDTAAEFQSAEPVLLEELSRNCQSAEDRENFKNVGLSIGQAAVNFTLKDTQGNEFRLSRLLAEKPVVMVFGSFT